MNVFTISVSLIRVSHIIKITKDKPIGVIIHLLVLKPVDENASVMTLTRAIYVSENSLFPCVFWSEFNWQWEVIFANFSADKIWSFQTIRSPPDAPTDGRKSNFLNFSGQKFLTYVLSKASLFVSCRVTIEQSDSAILFDRASHFLGHLSLWYSSSKCSRIYL